MNTGATAAQSEFQQEGRGHGVAKPVSIIVPVLNEAKLVANFVQNVRQVAPGVEIIVADGHSCDGTAEIARELADRVVITQAGRAVQMNAGAQAATGDILWFLHVDAQAPPECVENIVHALCDERVAGGYFRIRLPRKELIFRATDTLAHYLGLLFRMRCGDHGFFCRRDLFFALGGFPEAPLMEDVEFYRALCRRGRVQVIRSRLVISPRRYEKRGPYRVTAAYTLIAVLFLFGMSRDCLWRLYRRLCA